MFYVLNEWTGMQWWQGWGDSQYMKEGWLPECQEMEGPVSQSWCYGMAHLPEDSNINQC